MKIVFPRASTDKKFDVRSFARHSTLTFIIIFRETNNGDFIERIFSRFDETFRTTAQRVCSRALWRFFFAEAFCLVVSAIKSRFCTRKKPGRDRAPLINWVTCNFHMTYFVGVHFDAFAQRLCILKT